MTPQWAGLALGQLGVWLAVAFALIRIHELEGQIRRLRGKIRDLPEWWQRGPGGDA